MTGYPRRWSLPDDRRIAVTVEIEFEAFEAQTTFTTIPLTGLNRFSISYGDYGWKAGVWRLLELLDRCGVTATVAANGKAADRSPEALRAATSLGMEVCAHGWVNDRLVEGETEELEAIRRSSAAIEAATGVRPVGWVSPGLMPTEHTLRLLAQEGYEWNADDASDDLPFVVDTGSGDIVVIPVQGFAHNDLAAWSLPRSSPTSVWDNFKDTFDVLYREGEAGRPGMLDITLHAHIAGRPTLQPTVQRMLEYAQDRDGVWFATKGEVARWCRGPGGPRDSN